MQTSKWGKPAWVLLHRVADDFEKSKEKLYFDFFNLLRYILPCKYCRLSYTQYIGELPIETYYDPKLHNKNYKMAMNYWLYSIHNKVNEKLRNQGHVKYKDPPFEAVCSKVYKDCDVFCSSIDFIYAVVFNYPIEPDKLIKKQYKQFFLMLGELLPGIEYRKHWNDSFKDPCDTLSFNQALQSRYSLIYWFYCFHHSLSVKLKECGLCKRIKSFETIYTKYENWRARCAEKTCRKKPTKAEIKKDIDNLLKFVKKQVK